MKNQYQPISIMHVRYSCRFIPLRTATQGAAVAVATKFPLARAVDATAVDATAVASLNTRLTTIF